MGCHAIDDRIVREGGQQRAFAAVRRALAGRHEPAQRLTHRRQGRDPLVERADLLCGQGLGRLAARGSTGGLVEERLDLLQAEPELLSRGFCSARMLMAVRSQVLGSGPGSPPWIRTWSRSR
jgi:hypothetical protein